MNFCKVDVTVKFYELPITRKDRAGVHVLLRCDNGIEVDALLKHKSWTKALRAIEGYEAWVGVISGKIGSLHKSGFTLTCAGVQVFEKKPKEAKEVAA